MSRDTKRGRIDPNIARQAAPGDVARAQCARRRTRRPAFTLVESVVTMSIVSLLLVAAMQTVGMSARIRLSQVTDARGPALANLLMSEILQRWYRDPDGAPVFGAEANESAGRAVWDDVDDYNGFTEKSLKSKSGSAIPDAGAYTWVASVVYASLSDSRIASGVDTGLLRVVVIVIGPSGRVYSLTALRSRFGELDLVPDVSTTHTTGITAELRVDADACVASGAAPLTPRP